MEPVEIIGTSLKFKSPIVNALLASGDTPEETAQLHQTVVTLNDELYQAAIDGTTRRYIKQFKDEGIRTLAAEIAAEQQANRDFTHKVMGTPRRPISLAEATRRSEKHMAKEAGTGPDMLSITAALTGGILIVGLIAMGIR